ncbi:hypothetical protein MRM81_12095 [bacterium 19GA11TI05]|uniref:Lipoprotein n=1 Tax=bacterium 19GA11TI05 TaxID=2920688 RepID=A0AAU6TSY0_UNCXX
MKKNIVFFIFFMMLSGCASVESDSVKKDDTINKIISCEKVKSFEAKSADKKINFIEMIKSSTLSLEADDYIKGQKTKQLLLLGADSSKHESMLSCFTAEKNNTIKSVSSEFNSIKNNTNNKEERDALIEMFSSWEAYISNMTPDGKFEFNKALAKYKNI